MLAADKGITAALDAREACHVCCSCSAACHCGIWPFAFLVFVWVQLGAATECTSVGTYYICDIIWSPTHTCGDASFPSHIILLCDQRIAEVVHSKMALFCLLKMIGASTCIFFMRRWCCNTVIPFSTPVIQGNPSAGCAGKPAFSYT